MVVDATRSASPTDVELANQRGRTRVRLALAACALFIVLVRALTYFEPAGVDESTYAVIARELLHGARLYVDVWDSKPPGVFLTYAAVGLITGFGPGLMFVLSVGTALCTLFAVYRAARFMGGPAAALAAAAVWALVSHDVLLQGNLPNATAFESAALAWAFVFVLEGCTLGAAIAFAAASFYMTGAVLIPAALAAGVLVWPQRGRPEEFRRVCTWAGVGLGTWGLAFLWASATGRLDRVVATMFTYGSWYVHYRFPTEVRPTWRLLLPLIAAAPLLAGIVWAARRPARPWVLLGAYAAGATASVLVLGHYFGHHFQVLAPPFAIGAGVALPQLWRTRRAWAFAAGACLLAWELLPLGFSPDQWARVGGGPKAVSSAVVARELDRVLPAGQTFAVWGSDPQLYFMAGRRPPTGVFFLEHLLGPLSAPMTALMLDGLRRHQPGLLVVDELVGKGGPVWRYLAADYTPLGAHVGNNGEFSFWARRGSTLEVTVTAKSVSMPTQDTLP